MFTYLLQTASRGTGAGQAHATQAVCGPQPAHSDTHTHTHARVHTITKHKKRKKAQTEARTTHNKKLASTQRQNMRTTAKYLSQQSQFGTQS